MGDINKERVSADILKGRLIKAAAAGWSRPNSDTEVGSDFDSWIDEELETYDVDFSTTLREMRPDWFNGHDKDHVGSLHWSNAIPSVRL